ncbi:MAG: DUF6763 family protein [Desulfurivibrionaceae bacterium]|nr:DUF6763 family protein [Desulfurivibrionaceae bacterium]
MIDDIIDPRIDQWYWEPKSDRSFTVLDYDEDEGIIEIQYFDGELDELDIDEWREMALEEVEQPEDWTGLIDKLEVDDLGYDEV